MVKGFRDFVLRGNVIDLAIAVVVGAAFTAVIGAFTENIVNPLIASVGSTETPGLGFFIRGGDEATFVDIGAVLAAVLNFLIVSAVVYVVLVVPMARLMEMRRRGEAAQVAATPADIALLQEIRDLLAAQGGASRT